MKTKKQSFCKALFLKIALLTALILGGENHVWANLIDNGDGTFTEDFEGIAKTYSPSSFTFPTGWNCKGTESNFNVGRSSTGDFPNYISEPSIYVMMLNTSTYLITPELEGNFSFWMRSSSSSSVASVKAYKCTYENEEWIIGDMISEITIAKSSPIAAMAEKSISFTGHSHVALLMSYVYIDNFTYTPYVEVGGDISVPTGLAASNPTATTIDLAWTAGADETKWQFCYGKSQESLDQKSGYVTANPYTLEGLEAGETYYVSIRALKDKFSDWSTPIEFSTTSAIAVTSVSVSPSSWEMLAGDTKSLAATVLPNDATDKTVTWESDDASVATVSSTGEVTAVAPGSATITVKSTADNTKTATCTITVTEPVKPTALKTKDLYSNYTYLTWTNGSTEENWQIKYGTTSGSLDNESGDITNSKKPYLITGLSSNTKYYASIRSKLGTAYSAWSDEINFTTPAVGPAPDGASNVTESFDSDWGTTSSLTIKSGWGYYSGKTNFSLDATYRYGDTGYGLKGGYSTSQYIISPELKVGSTFKFRACRATSNTYSTGTVKLYKTIKVGNTYYIDDKVVYSNISLPNGTEITMDNIQSCIIPEGGYVAIQLSYSAIDDITYQSSSTVSVVTDENGFTTFANSNKLDMIGTNLPSGLEAYKAKVDGSIVKFTQINQNVPENTGVLLEGNANTEYRIAIAESSSEVEDNDFLVNSTGYTFAPTSGYTYFAMKKNSNPLMFATFNPSSVAIPSNKAYLKVEDIDGTRQLTCMFNEEGGTTGINMVQSEGLRKSNFYNLQGQRVDNPTKGLYIKDGKKVMVK